MTVDEIVVLWMCVERAATNEKRTKQAVGWRVCEGEGALARSKQNGDLLWHGTRDKWISWLGLCTEGFWVPG